MALLCDWGIEKVWFRWRMFGDCEAAKPEHGGRTEQKSASDLSTQTTALLLSTRPQTDNELCSYIIYWQGLKSFHHTGTEISLNQSSPLEASYGNMVFSKFTVRKKNTTRGGGRNSIWLLTPVVVETEYRYKQGVKGCPVMACLPKTKRMTAGLRQHLPCHHIHDMSNTPQC